MQFNRRQNRVAGPGFYVNVRYDDIHVDYAKNSAAQDAQLHPELNKGLREPELFDIKEQEILVCRKTGESYTASYGDGYTHCFSAANGFRINDINDTTKGAKSPSDVERAVLDKVQFVGIANTEYVPTKGYEQQGFVAQVGGVTTLLNESTQTIYPGDKLMFGLDLGYGRKVTRDKGIPRQKIRFCLKRAVSDTEMIEIAMEKAGVDCDKDNDCKQAAAKVVTARDAYNKSQTRANAKLLQDAQDAHIKKLLELSANGGATLFGEFLKKYKELNERVIGKSYSYAKPGDRLEVGLQPRNAF